MSQQRKEGFFYGLFMDADILESIGVRPVNPRRAYADGYALRIGKRATLVPSDGDRAYGVVFSLTDEEFARLYAAPGLEEYQPRTIRVQVLEGDVVLAACYNLREAPKRGEANEEYAARLREVLRKLDFPAEYVDSVH